MLLLGDTPYDVAAAQRVGAVALRRGGWSDRDLAGALAVYADPRICCIATRSHRREAGTRAVALADINRSSCLPACCCVSRGAYIEPLHCWETYGYEEGVRHELERETFNQEGAQGWLHDELEVDNQWTGPK